MKPKTYGETLSVLTNNLKRGKNKGERDSLIHISQEPVSEPLLKPFENLKDTQEKLRTGEIQRINDHWKPINKAEQEIEDYHSVRAYI